MFRCRVAIVQGSIGHTLLKSPLRLVKSLESTMHCVINLQDNSIVLEKFDSVETGPLANVLACEGKPGKAR